MGPECFMTWRGPEGLQTCRGHLFCIFVVRLAPYWRLSSPKPRRAAYCGNKNPMSNFQQLPAPYGATTLSPVLFRTGGRTLIFGAGRALTHPFLYHSLNTHFISIICVTCNRAIIYLPEKGVMPSINMSKGGTSFSYFKENTHGDN